MAGDLMIRVKFTGTDRLSRMLDNISGSSQRTGRALSEANRSLRTQRTELRDVQRQLAATSGNVTVLLDKERALEASIVSTNKRLEQQKKLLLIDSRTARAEHLGKDMVASGQMALMSTALLAAPMLAVAHASGEFEATRNKMRVLGLGGQAVDDLTAFAKAMDVAGSSVNENMRYLLEAQGVFRESGEHDMAHQLAGAKLMAPLLARMHVTAQATGRELTEDQERYFLRFVEQAGGLTNGKRAAELTDGLFRALQSSGGNVKASDYQGFLAHAGVAGSHLSNRAMFADFEPLIGELHEAAGVGLATAFKQASGLKVNSRAANEFLKLGMWDAHKVVFNAMGGVKTTKGNPLNTRAADLLQHDPVEFYRQIVMPAYERAGIKTSEGRAFENAKLFGGTGGNLFNLLDKQLPTILRSREAFAKTQSLDQAYDQTNDSFFGQQGKLRAAAKDFMVAAGTKGGLLDNMTALMQRATTALRAFTAFGNAHPTAFAWIGTIVTNLLLLRAGAAISKIAFGGALGPVARLWGALEKLKVAGEFTTAFPRIVKALGFLRAGFFMLSRGVMQAGMMMLANPMVLAIVAIGVAIGVTAYLVYKHWAGIKAAFGTALSYLSGLWQRFKAAGGQLMDGLLGGITEKLAALKSGIFGLGEKVIGWFKAKLGIHSPSRVFHQLGGFLTHGLANGIDRGADRPLRRMRKMAGSLAAVAAMGTVGPVFASSGAGAGAMAATPAGMSIGNVTIVIQQLPGQSATDVAAEVKRQLEQIGRGHAAARRSSYADED